MFQRELIIMGLRRQRSLLSELREELDQKPVLAAEDCLVCEARADHIASNLKKLRDIHRSYFPYAGQEPGLVR